jgi:hypothetical protein
MWTIGWFVAIASFLACAADDFHRAQSVATDFAGALQRGDTVRMRELSMPSAAVKMGAAQREIPPVYTDFAHPHPEITTIEGGGIYGSGAYTVFRAQSKQLAPCHGGVRILLVKAGRDPRVTAVIPDPPIDSLFEGHCPLPRR